MLTLNAWIACMKPIVPFILKIVPNAEREFLQSKQITVTDHILMTLCKSKRDWVN